MYDETKNSARLPQFLLLAAGGYHLAPVTLRWDPSADDGRGKKVVQFHGSWQHNATTDPDQIRRWFNEHPWVSFAISCEPSGICVVDVDGPQAIEWLSEESQASLRSFEVVTTQSDGRHHYFRENPRHEGVPSKAGLLWPKVDTRGRGGVIFAPGSVVLELDQDVPVPGREYKVQVGATLPSVDQLTIAPSKLYERLHKAQEARDKAAGGMNGGTTASGDSFGSGVLWTTSADHDREWVEKQIERSRARLIACRGAGGFRTAFRVFAGVLFMAAEADLSRCDNPSPIVTYDDVDRMLEDATQAVWGFPMNDDDASWAQKVYAEWRASGARWTIKNNYAWEAMGIGVSTEDINLDDAHSEVIQPTPTSSSTSAGVRPIDLTLPDEFWETRPALKQIRQAAWSGYSSPDVALYAILTRMAGLCSHRIRAYTFGPASLNFYAAVVGTSGAGKSGGDDLAEEFIPQPEGMEVQINPIGTGQGICEAYMGRIAKTEPTVNTAGEFDVKRTFVRGQEFHNAIFYSDEGQQLVQQLQTQGQVLGPVIRGMWQSEVVGQQNAKAENTRRLAKNSYATGMFIAFQPMALEQLLLAGEIDLGTPQRFAYVSPIDPRVTRERIPHPGPFEWDPQVLALGEHEDEIMITFPDSAVDEMIGFRVDKTNGSLFEDGDFNPLDGHMPLMKTKMSALLALLDQRRQVNEEDWRLAEMMWVTSCLVRENVIAGAHKRRQAAEKEKTGAQIRTAVAAASAVRRQERSETEKAAEAIAKKARASVTDGAVTTGEIKRVLRNYSACFDAAVKLAAEYGWIELLDPPAGSGKRSPYVITGLSPFIVETNN